MPWNNTIQTLFLLEELTGTFSGFFGYSGTPANGNLIFSLTASAGGTDPFNNTYYGPGLALYGTNGEYILLAVSGGIATITFATGVSFEGTKGLIKSGIIDSGAAEQMQLLMAGPATNVAGAKDLALVLLQSNNEGGTSNAQGELIMQSTLGALTTELAWGPLGVTIFNLATASVTMPSGLVGNLTVGGQSDVSTTTVTQAAQTQLCAGYSINASDAAIGSTYILETSGTGTQGSTAETLTIAAAFSVLGTAGTGITFPATFAAISTAFRWKARVTARCVTTGSGGTWQVTCDATVTSAAGSISGTSTNATAVAFSTIVAQTVSLSAAWGATTGAPTLSSHGSYFQKMV